MIQPSKRFENELRTVKPPYVPRTDLRVFLAGSIESGTAEEWQTKVEKAFVSRGDIVFFNPRREEWDSSWECTITNPLYVEQVMWELSHLDKADIIVMYFDPSTKSPISLLELGLYAASGKLRVCCPEGFYRKGNVDIVCQKYSIPQYESLDKLIESIKLSSVS